MKTRTLVLLVPFFASCGGSGWNARDASVDGAAESADVPQSGFEAAVDRPLEFMDASESSYDAPVDGPGGSMDAPEPREDALLDAPGGSTDAPEPREDAQVEVLPGTWDTQEPREGGVDARNTDGLAGSGCRFRDTSGGAVITKVDSSPNPGRECMAVVTFDFIAGLTWDAGSAPLALDGGSTGDAGARTAGGRMVISPIENPPCSYLVSNGVVVGALLPAIRQDAIAGACPTPVYVFPGIENSQYMGP